MRTLTQGIPPFPTRTIHNLEIVKFDSKNIQKHLEKLKETKSSGPDQIHPKFLKETAKILHYHWRKLLIHQWKPCQYQTVGGWQI
jgi:hypothetical protein